MTDHAKANIAEIAHRYIALWSETDQDRRQAGSIERLSFKSGASLAKPTLSQIGYNFSDIPDIFS